MKKIIIILTIFFSTISAISAEEVKRIVVGSKDAKITIIAFESLTCSHCANFHKDVYPELKKDFIDKGLVKIEFRHFPLDAAAFNASKVSQCKNDGDFLILSFLTSLILLWYLLIATFSRLASFLKKIFFSSSKLINLSFSTTE